MVIRNLTVVDISAPLPEVEPDTRAFVICNRTARPDKKTAAFLASDRFRRVEFYGKYAMEWRSATARRGKSTGGRLHATTVALRAFTGEIRKACTTDPNHPPCLLLFDDFMLSTKIYSDVYETVEKYRIKILAEISEPREFVFEGMDCVCAQDNQQLWIGPVGREHVIEWREELLDLPVFAGYTLFDLWPVMNQ